MIPRCAAAPGSITARGRAQPDPTSTSRIPAMPSRPVNQAARRCVPALRGGPWDYHGPWTGPAGPNLHVKNPGNAITPGEPAGVPLISTAPAKPIRFWFAVGDQDLFYPNPVMADGMHDWVLAAELMAKVLADKGNHYQVVVPGNSQHVDRPTVAQTLPSALEWLWKGYPVP